MGGMSMYSTVLAHNRFISLVLLCYEDICASPLRLFVHPQSTCRYFSFLHFISATLSDINLVTQILSFRSVFYFFSSVISCSPSGVFTSFLKLIPSYFADGLADQRVIICWWIIRFQSLFCHSLFPSVASFSHLLPVWMLLGWFPIFPVILMHLSHFWVTFPIFQGSSLPRPEAFLGLHSHFSLISSGMTPGTLTFSPDSNLPQSLNKLQWWLVVSFRSYPTVALMKSERQQYGVLICACCTTDRPWEYQPAPTGKPSSVFFVTAYWKLTTNSCFWVFGTRETWYHCELFQFLASQYKLLYYFRLAACDGHGHTFII